MISPNTMVTMGRNWQDMQIVSVTPERLYPSYSLLWGRVREAERVVYRSKTGYPLWNVQAWRVLGDHKEDPNHQIRESVSASGHSAGIASMRRTEEYEGFGAADWVKEMGDAGAIRRERDRRVNEVDWWLKSSTEMIQVGETVETGGGYLREMEFHGL
ncbi:hypothetical protein KIPB_006522 [Kipferlia bialata]|uniref:Uncharacterized protein n=1 Tax=Kipferlia bialata TaxID=797122 RepID=A0A9K3CYX5_9EUKA|nr:hypothetical protein KIPB_006522 [Kipferlia bialata]|eukprot:g6522.t1